MSSGIPVARAGALAHWLLDLAVGGRVARFSDVDLIVPRGAEDLAYVSGLGDLAIQLGASPTTVAITLEPYAGAISWWALVARGSDLASGRASLRLWHEGTDYEDAEVYALGFLVEPEYGADDEEFTFSIDSSRWDRTDSIPPEAQRVDPTTWPVVVTPFPLSADPDTIGAAYPWIYGRPGRGGIDVWGTFFFDAPASPAYVAEWGDGAHIINESRLVVAGHAVGAAQVQITDVSGGYNPGPRPGSSPPTITDTFDVEEYLDLRGQLVSTVKRGSDQKKVRFIAGNEYWVAWTTGGGRVDPRTGQEIRGAGAVIVDLLDASGTVYDRGRQAAAAERLNALLLDAAISEPVRAEDWIEDQIGSLIPLLRRESTEGVWFELWRWDATAADVEAHLVADTADERTAEGYIVERTSAIRWGDLRNIENDITVNYVRCKQGFARSFRMRPVASPNVADRELGSLLAQVSASRYGVRPVEFDTDIIAEDSAASFVLSTRIAWKGLARRSFSVEGGPELIGLAPNSVITYTEAAVGIERALALVTEVTIGLDTISATIELLDRPSDRGSA